MAAAVAVLAALGTRFRFPRGSLRVSTRWRVLAETWKIGSRAETWAHRCIALRGFPPQAFNTLRGMIKLAREHGAERVDEACAEALARERLASGFLRVPRPCGDEPSVRHSGSTVPRCSPPVQG